MRVFDNSVFKKERHMCADTYAGICCLRQKEKQIQPKDMFHPRPKVSGAEVAKRRRLEKIPSDVKTRNLCFINTWGICYPRDFKRQRFFGPAAERNVPMEEAHSFPFSTVEVMFLFENDQQTSRRQPVLLCNAYETLRAVYKNQRTADEHFQRFLTRLLPHVHYWRFFTSEAQRQQTRSCLEAKTFPPLETDQATVYTSFMYLNDKVMEDPQHVCRVISNEAVTDKYYQLVQVPGLVPEDMQRYLAQFPMYKFGPSANSTEEQSLMSLFDPLEHPPGFANVQETIFEVVPNSLKKEDSLKYFQNNFQNVVNSEEFKRNMEPKSLVVREPNANSTTWALETADRRVLTSFNSMEVHLHLENRRLEAQVENLRKEVVQNGQTVTRGMEELKNSFAELKQTLLNTDVQVEDKSESLLSNESATVFLVPEWGNVEAFCFGGVTYVCVTNQTVGLRFTKNNLGKFLRENCVRSFRVSTLCIELQRFIRERYGRRVLKIYQVNV